MSIELYKGDCRESLELMDLIGREVDSVVTDPPYGLGFMGRSWDKVDTPFRSDFWRLVMRVLKPGGHLLAFGGTRTFHRTAVAIEDAGFEIRDTCMWLYGSGFPKSQNVAKKGAGEAWDGWGTALKPAWEPIIVARKPLSERNVAINVLTHGTGAFNIDGCRIEYVDDTDKAGATPQGACTARPGSVAGGGFYEERRTNFERPEQKGRFPANVIHDGSDEVVKAFPETSSGKPGTMRKDTNDSSAYGAESRPPGTLMSGYGYSGSAARFFYSSKASKKDRAGSRHPTVKPVSLMAYLCKLVTPPGGTVLDPFAGSGTTGQAALDEGFNVILCEREAEYIADLERRFQTLLG